MAYVCQSSTLAKGAMQLSRFKKGLGALLPDAYLKFWREWKLTPPTAVVVHFIKDNEWRSGIFEAGHHPIKCTPESPDSDRGIWDGDIILHSFMRKRDVIRHKEDFNVGKLKRVVIRSEVLNEHMTMTTTETILHQIYDSGGVDHYLLQNLACNLRSDFALKLKRKLLLELFYGCPRQQKNLEVQQDILSEYERYLEPYTEDEIDWYGYTYREAICKLRAQLNAKRSLSLRKFKRQQAVNEKRQKTPDDSVFDEKKLGIPIEKLTYIETFNNWLWNFKVYEEI